MRQIDDPHHAEHQVQAKPDQGGALVWTSLLVERATYGGVEPSAEEITRALDFTRACRGRRTGRTASPPGPQPRDSANASSNEAPAASSGR